MCTWMLPTGVETGKVSKMISSNLQKTRQVRESRPDSVSLGRCEGRQERWADDDESLLDEHK